MNPQLATRLRSLRLSGMVDAFPGRLAQAQAAPLGHADFLAAFQRSVTLCRTRFGSALTFPRV